MLGQSHKFYRSQWVGALPEGYDIPYRGNAFTNETGPTRLAWGDITGGIMEGGEAGTALSALVSRKTFAGFRFEELSFRSGHRRTLDKTVPLWPPVNDSSSNLKPASVFSRKWLVRVLQCKQKAPYMKGNSGGGEVRGGGGVGGGGGGVAGLPICTTLYCPRSLW